MRDSSRQGGGIRGSAGSRTANSFAGCCFAIVYLTLFGRFPFALHNFSPFFFVAEPQFGLHCSETVFIFFSRAHLAHVYESSFLPAYKRTILSTAVLLQLHIATAAPVQPS